MTDTPHYVTPEEAREVGCPLSMAGNPHIAHKSCLGPNCMAWRWGKEFYEKTVEFEGGAFIKETWRHSTTHGFCGMVRS